MSLKISIIYGSTRDGRLGIRFAKYLTKEFINRDVKAVLICLLYTSPSPRDVEESRMPSSA